MKKDVKGIISMQMISYWCFDILRRSESDPITVRGAFDRSTSISPLFVNGITLGCLLA